MREGKRREKSWNRTGCYVCRGQATLEMEVVVQEKGHTEGDGQGEAESGHWGKVKALFFLSRLEGKN